MSVLYMIVVYLKVINLNTVLVLPVNPQIFEKNRKKPRKIAFIGIGEY